MAAARGLLPLAAAALLAATPASGILGNAPASRPSRAVLNAQRAELGQQGGARTRPRSEALAKPGGRGKSGSSKHNKPRASRASSRPGLQYARVGPAADIEALWQRPEGQVKGLLFFAHGCKHQAPDAWASDALNASSSCLASYYGECLGLPENVLMQESARRRGYLVAAVSGGSGKRSCWDGRKDPERVRLALEHIARTEGLGRLPVVLMGSSSGGTVLGEVAGELAAAQQSLGRNVTCVSPSNAIIKVPKGFPREVRVAFQYMDRDAVEAKSVEESVKALKAHGAKVGTVKVKPQAVTEEFLNCHGTGLPSETAARVVGALRDAKLLDEDGLLTSDPRTSEWRKAMKDLGAEIGGLEADESALGQLLNSAYALHESFGRNTDRILDFCEKPL